MCTTFEIMALSTLFKIITRPPTYNHTPNVDILVGINFQMTDRSE